MRLTDAAIRALKPREKVYDVYDDDVKCFGVRVCPGGAKTFTFFYRLGGKKKRLSLGEYPFTTLAHARRKAHGARGTVKSDRQHPELPEAPPTAQSETVTTVKGLCERYLASERFSGAREATRHQFDRIVKVEILPALGGRELGAVAPGDLADWAQGIIDRGAPVTANQSFKILRLIWNWGRKRLVREGIPPFPLAGFGKPWDGEKPRKRHLSIDLMKKFVEAVDEEPRMTAVWWLLMLLNLTRKTETCLLAKDEIVWKSQRGAYMVVPGHKSKNHQPLFQPLTEYSKLLLQLVLPHSGDSPWVMPGRGKPGKEPKPLFQRTGVPGTRVSRRIGVKVSPHDLRHTVATILGELDIEPHVIDALQNHRLPRSTDVTGTYNDALVWAYFDQKRAALERWHQHLDKKILKGRLKEHIRQAVEGKKEYEEAMKQNMKLGPRSRAHKLAMKRRTAAAARLRIPA